MKAGSIERGEAQQIAFEVSDAQATIRVRYQGLLPDLFREGQGMVAQGAFDAAGRFTASEVLAKHDENYMPPEVARGLEQAAAPTRTLVER